MGIDETRAQNRAQWLSRQSDRQSGQVYRIGDRDGRTGLYRATLEDGGVVQGRKIYNADHQAGDIVRANSDEARLWALDQSPFSADVRPAIDSTSALGHGNEGSDRDERDLGARFSPQRNCLGYMRDQVYSCGEEDQDVVFGANIAYSTPSLLTAYFKFGNLEWADQSNLIWVNDSSVIYAGIAFFSFYSRSLVYGGTWIEYPDPAKLGQVRAFVCGFSPSAAPLDFVDTRGNTSAEVSALPHTLGDLNDRLNLGYPYPDRIKLKEDAGLPPREARDELRSIANNGQGHKYIDDIYKLRYRRVERTSSEILSIVCDLHYLDGANPVKVGLSYALTPPTTSYWEGTKSEWLDGIQALFGLNYNEGDLITAIDYQNSRFTLKAFWK